MLFERRETSLAWLSLENGGRLKIVTCLLLLALASAAWEAHAKGTGPAAKCLQYYPARVDNKCQSNVNVALCTIAPDASSHRCSDGKPLVVDLAPGKSAEFPVQLPPGALRVHACAGKSPTIGRDLKGACR